MSTISLNTSLGSAVTLLGGEGVLRAKPRVVMDWIPLVRRGLPSACVDAVVRTTRITQSDLAGGRKPCRGAYCPAGCRLR